MSHPSPPNPNPSQSPATSTLLGRLRSAVGKLRLLLRNATPQYSSSWRLISAALLRRRQPYRRLSLTDRRPSGLIDLAADYEPEPESESESSVRRSNSNAASASAGSSPPGGRVLHRTASCPESAGSGSGGEEGDEDVDWKAEMFIANFYRQLRLEKQVSLELRYCRGYSFGSSADPSPGSNWSFASPT